MTPESTTITYTTGIEIQKVDENGEPRIIRIDNELDNEEHYVADNLMDFIRLILRNEEIKEKPLN